MLSAHDVDQKSTLANILGASFTVSNTDWRYVSSAAERLAASTAGDVAVLLTCSGQQVAHSVVCSVSGLKCAT